MEPDRSRVNPLLLALLALFTLMLAVWGLWAMDRWYSRPVAPPPGYEHVGPER